MKPVYKCEYCDNMGDETTIREHEQKCRYNPANKTCYSCKYAKIYGGWGGSGGFSSCNCTKIALSHRSTLDVKDCWEQGTPKTIIGM